MDKRKFFRKSRILCLCIVVLVVSLNVAAWNSTAFSDWYIAYIFPVWVNLYGRVTGLFDFSVGEWMLVAGVVLVALALIIGAIWAGVGVTMAIRSGLRRSIYRTKRMTESVYVGGAAAEAEGVGNTKAAGGFRKFSRKFYSFFLWVLVIVSLVMTLNCFILYHASTFSEHYFGEDEGEYTLVELIGIYNMVAEQCNYFARVMERDESGMVLYGGSVGVDGEILDMADTARMLMRRLGEIYPQLDGFYPRPKALLSSDFMCQQHMQGYYFPFSMEANYNDVMHILNIPSTMCHELAHLRGYIYEDEANFIGYLACVSSEDPFFQYAGYLSVLNYLNNDLYRAMKNSGTSYEEAIKVIRPVTVDEQVWEDNIFVAQEEWDRINGKALIDTEVVDKAADVFIDTNLKVNGVADGAASYSRVVRLLLQYYFSDNFAG
ncbi:MAG: DUF3810 domain-containing protein [Lachnospiraceae bacterium]|nr:DUF3810 domain-containing protein [Lachnospiraceae bacterium]